MLYSTFSHTPIHTKILFSANKMDVSNTSPYLTPLMKLWTKRPQVKLNQAVSKTVNQLLYQAIYLFCIYYQLWQYTSSIVQGFPQCIISLAGWQALAAYRLNAAFFIYIWKKRELFKIVLFTLWTLNWMCLCCTELFSGRAEPILKDGDIVDAPITLCWPPNVLLKLHLWSCISEVYLCVVCVPPLILNVLFLFWILFYLLWICPMFSISVPCVNVYSVH